MRISYPPELPISAYHDEIVATVTARQCVVVVGETGSGKTTQLPKLCLEACGLSATVAVTQPRRIAVTGMSQRVADETEALLGREVGLAVRFLDRRSSESRIIFLTEGILLNELASDPLLRRYNAIIVDEAHERTAQVDLILAHLRRILPRRPDLRLVISSASMQAERLAAYFNNAPILTIPGRTFPISIQYWEQSPSAAKPLNIGRKPLEDDYVSDAIRATTHLLTKYPVGDCLIFMPTEQDIRDTVTLLKKVVGGKVEILPLYSRLPLNEQNKVFFESCSRRVIVATNVAETSLTIPRIRYVVDTGLVRVKRYNPRTKTEVLAVERAPQSSALQRAGRCGRLGPGTCIRLFSEEDLASRALFPEPEIRRINLAELVLRALAFRLGSLEELELLDAPESAAIRSAIKQLVALGAMSEINELTERGRKLARLPVDPTIGTILLEGQRMGILEDTLVVAAGLSVNDPRVEPPDKLREARTRHRQALHPDSDLLSLLQLWNELIAVRKKLSRRAFIRFCHERFISPTRFFEWELTRGHLREILSPKSTHAAYPTSCLLGGEDLREVTITSPLYERLHCAALAGFILSVCRSNDGGQSYTASSGRVLSPFPSSTLAPSAKDRRRDMCTHRRKPERPKGQVRWAFATEITETSRLYGRGMARISPTWILKVAPPPLLSRNYGDPFYHPPQQRVVCRETVSLFGMELHRHLISYQKVAPERAHRLFVQEALIEGILSGPTFIEENRKILEEHREAFAALRMPLPDTAYEALADFYRSCFGLVASRAELDVVLRNRKAEDGPLTINRTLLPPLPVPTTSLPPRTICLEGYESPVQYQYDPKGLRDGCFVQLPASVIIHSREESLIHYFPHLQRAIIRWLVDHLPRKVRQKLPSDDELGRGWCESAATPTPASFIRIVHTRYGVTIPEDLVRSIPNHLIPIAEVLDAQGIVVTRGQNLRELRLALREKQIDHPLQATALTEWKKEFERDALQFDAIPKVPPVLTTTMASGVPLFVYPALTREGNVIALRLVSHPPSAESQEPLLCELCRPALTRELQDITRPIRSIKDLSKLIFGIGSTPQFISSIEDLLLVTVLCHIDISVPLNSLVQQLITSAKEHLASFRPRIPALIESILLERRKLLSLRTMPHQCRDELGRLFQPHFPDGMQIELLNQYPRYLSALRIRSDRAHASPDKDRVKSMKLRPLIDAFEKLPQTIRPKIAPYLEELRIATFAPELGTLYPVSEKGFFAYLRKINQAHYSLLVDKITVIILSAHSGIFALICQVNEVHLTLQQ